MDKVLILNAEIGAPEIKDVSGLQGFFMEFAGAVFLQLVFLYFVENENAPKVTDGFSVGSMFGICILSTNHFTGAAINPARAFGPLILSLKIWLIPLYLLAPVLGSIFGSLLYSYMLEDLDTEATRQRKKRDQARKAALEAGEKSDKTQGLIQKKSFKEDQDSSHNEKELKDLDRDTSTVL